MPRTVQDPELAEYRKLISPAEYHRQYLALYMKSKHNVRYSGKTYTNSDSKIQVLKEKYKNGVPKEEINKMLGIKEEKDEV